MDLEIHLWRTGDFFTQCQQMNKQIVCYFAHILHRFADSRAKPPLDNSQDISDADATFSDGVTVITFTRPRNSGDSRDISLDEGRFLLFAWGGSVTYGATNSIGNHGMNRRQFTSEAVNFPNATECPSKSIACKEADQLCTTSSCVAFTYFNTSVYIVDVHLYRPEPIIPPKLLIILSRISH